MAQHPNRVLNISAFGGAVASSHQLHEKVKISLLDFKDSPMLWYCIKRRKMLI